MAGKRFFRRPKEPREWRDLAPIKPGESDGPAKVYVKELGFRDGTVMKVPSNGITVFCGPNNAGKSLALREIIAALRDGVAGNIVKTVDVEKIGSVRQITRLILDHSTPHYSGSNIHLKGVGFHMIKEGIGLEWSSPRLGDVADFFVDMLETETRLTDCDPVDNVGFRDHKEHPLHHLYADIDATRAISRHFERVFDKSLMIDYSMGASVGLYVGREPEITPESTPVSKDYVTKLHDEAEPLHEQGDGMRSFATVLLRTLAAGHKTLIFIDEPEAFLHPPQARMLGEFLARHIPREVQIFIATHSVDLLSGILSYRSDRINVVRLSRADRETSVHVLSNSQMSELWSDPVARHSGMLSAIFHKRAVICEADADCLFYSLIGQAVSPDDYGRSEILFINANGKGGINRFSAPLIAMGVTTTAVADLDLISDEQPLRAIFTSLGGQWSEISADYRLIKKAVEDKKPLMLPNEVKAELIRILGGRDYSSTRDLRADLSKVLANASPWDYVKHAGTAGIPSGQASAAFQRLDAKCREVGLWLVPVGEIEGFCRTIDAAHGPRFVKAVIEACDLAVDPQLADARSFVTNFLH